MKLHGYKWNQRDRELIILILTEYDIETKCDEFYHVGYNMLILPSKYEHCNDEVMPTTHSKDIQNYLDTVKMVIKARNGEIIYV